jgi:hypothetical protein
LIRSLGRFRCGAEPAVVVRGGHLGLRRRHPTRRGRRVGGGQGGEVAAQGGDDAAEGRVLDQRVGMERPAREGVGPAAAPRKEMWDEAPVSYLFFPPRPLPPTPPLSLGGVPAAAAATAPRCAVAGLV